MANKQYSAIGIKKLWYGEPLAAAPTAATATNGLEEVKNVHQDTWQIEESEASQDSYKNQLTGSTYRMGQKNMGELTVQFTIGRYDHQLKKDLLGGDVIKNGEEIVGWSRAKGITDIKKCIVALTEDDEYVVLPYANMIVREANTDGAIGLAVSAVMLEPESENVMPEYWFDAPTA